MVALVDNRTSPLKHEQKKLFTVSPSLFTFCSAPPLVHAVSRTQSILFLLLTWHDVVSVSVEFQPHFKWLPATFLPRENRFWKFLMLS